MIFWKAETKCMSSLDHSFLVKIVTEKRGYKEKRMPLTNRESQVPQDPPKYRATGMLTFSRTLQLLDCKTVSFFLKISKEIGKAWRKSLYAREAREPGRVSVSPQTFCFTVRAYLNMQKYGLYCSLYSCKRWSKIYSSFKDTNTSSVST